MMVIWRHKGVPMVYGKKKITATESVVEQIINRLKRGEFKPGSQLPPQRELASLLGFGRSTIREALNALSGMGYVEATQGKGTFIRNDLSSTRPVHPADKSFLEVGTIFDLMEAREILECNTVKLASQKADKSAMFQIQEAVERLRKYQNDIPKFFDADWSFHNAIAEMHGNKVICEMIRLIMEKMHRYNIQFRATTSRKNREFALRTADQILTHLINGEGDKAAESMRSHLSTINNELKEIILELAPMMIGIKK